jgi:CheY-like chemotaxis protein
LFLAGPSADTSAAEASPNQGAEVHRALVVEDNPVNSLLAVKLLERLGFECHTAESGHGALQRFSEVPYSVIFMDCQMPEMDGYEASAAIRGLASGGTVPIVAVTAHAVAEDRERCMAAGMSAYLSKPITLECLRQVLRQVGVPCSR